MEEPLEHFPREVRNDIGQSRSGWEDVGGNPESTGEKVKYFLDKYGLDLKKVKMLEVGSGDGRLLNYLKNQDVDIMGVDSRPRGKSNSLVALARIEQIPFANQSFDVIISTSVFDDLLYEQNQELMRKEIFRVLKPGGYYMSFGDQPTQSIDEMELIYGDSDNFTQIYRKI